jgi:hypothetical protein
MLGEASISRPSRALIGTDGIDQATDRVAFGEKDAGHFRLLEAGRWRFAPKCTSEQLCPTIVIIGHTHHQKNRHLKIKGYCTNWPRFADLADALEHAAQAIARLDALLTGHPLGSGVSGSRPSAGKPRPTGGRSTRGIWPPSSKASDFVWIAPWR